MDNLAFFVLIVYGVPILIGIILIRFLILKFGSRRTANITTVALFVTMIGVFVSFIVYDINARTHHSSVKICQNVLLEIESYEEDHFLDWSVNFNGKLIIDNVEHEFTFNTAEGPYLDIEVDSNELRISTHYPAKYELITLPIKRMKCNTSKQYRMNSNFEIHKQ